jgi:hypothetical protein
MSDDKMFTGRIDEVTVFNHVLTPAELLRLARPLTRWQRFVRWMRMTWWRVVDALGMWGES